MDLLWLSRRRLTRLPGGWWSSIIRFASTCLAQRRGGESGPDSDLDFCVVLPDDAQESIYRDRSIHEVFWGLEAGVDVVRLANSDFDARAAHVVASLPATVVREGWLLYDARRIAA
jgi:hypothetical protein